MIRVADLHAAAAAMGLPALASRLGLRVSPRSTAARLVASCVWHSPDTHPAMALAMRNGRVVAHCHACGAGGTEIDMVAALRGLDVRRDWREVLGATADLLGVRDDGSPAPAPRPRDPRTEMVERVDALAGEWLRGADLSGREWPRAADADAIEALGRARPELSREVDTIAACLRYDVRHYLRRRREREAAEHAADAERIEREAETMQRIADAMTARAAMGLPAEPADAVAMLRAHGLYDH